MKRGSTTSYTLEIENLENIKQVIQSIKINFLGDSLITKELDIDDELIITLSAEETRLLNNYNKNINIDIQIEMLTIHDEIIKTTIGKIINEKEVTL